MQYKIYSSDEQWLPSIPEGILEVSAANSMQVTEITVPPFFGTGGPNDFLSSEEVGFSAKSSSLYENLVHNAVTPAIKDLCLFISATERNAIGKMLNRMLAEADGDMLMENFSNIPEVSAISNDDKGFIFWLPTELSGFKPASFKPSEQEPIPEDSYESEVLELSGQIVQRDDKKYHDINVYAATARYCIKQVDNGIWPRCTAFSYSIPALCNMEYAFYDCRQHPSQIISRLCKVYEDYERENPYDLLPAVSFTENELKEIEHKNNEVSCNLFLICLYN